MLKIYILGKGSLIDLAWVLYLLLGWGKVEHLNDGPTNITHSGGEITSLQKARVLMKNGNGSGWASDPKEIFTADLYLVVLRTNRGGLEWR